MREAIGGISIFQIVIVLILLFVGIMCLTINHSKAFGVKDEIVTIIESNTLEKTNDNNQQHSYGFGPTMQTTVQDQLTKSGYHILGDCPDDTYDGYGIDGKPAGKINGVAFCIRANRVEDEFATDAETACQNGKCQTTSNEFPTMIYYDVVLFFQLDIPVINYLFNFNLKGTTKIMFGGIGV